MRIWCTVLRKNGSYKTVAVKAGKTEFELDKNKYNIKNYRIGNIGPIHVLRAVYAEGIFDPLDFDVDVEMQKVNLKLDSKAIKNVTNKKILDVLSDTEFTKMEKIFILLMFVNLALGAINLILNVTIMHKLGLF
jgi:hypothetical protein